MSKDDKWCKFYLNVYMRRLKTRIAIFNIAVYSKIKTRSENSISAVHMDVKLIEAWWWLKVFWIDLLKYCKPGLEPLTFLSMANWNRFIIMHFQCVHGYKTCIYRLDVNRPII